MLTPALDLLLTLFVFPPPAFMYSSSSSSVCIQKYLSIFMECRRKIHQLFLFYGNFALCQRNELCFFGLFCVFSRDFLEFCQGIFKFMESLWGKSIFSGKFLFECVFHLFYFVIILFVRYFVFLWFFRRNFFYNKF